MRKQNHILYFAYGNNMLADTMLRRCGEPGPDSYTLLGPARLDGYRLVFNTFSSDAGPKDSAESRQMKNHYSSGAVSSILPAQQGEPGCPVFGGLYAFSPDILALIDRAEAYPRLYDRRQLPVLLLHGSVSKTQLLSAWVYISALPRAEVSPDPEYLDRLRRGAAELNLPTEYQNFLASFAVEC